MSGTDDIESATYNADDAEDTKTNVLTVSGGRAGTLSRELKCPITVEYVSEVARHAGIKHFNAFSRNPDTDRMEMISNNDWPVNKDVVIKEVNAPKRDQ